MSATCAVCTPFRFDRPHPTDAETIERALAKGWEYNPHDSMPGRVWLEPADCKFRDAKTRAEMLAIVREEWEAESREVTAGDVLLEWHDESCDSAHDDDGLIPDRCLATIAHRLAAAEAQRRNEAL